MYYQHNDDDDWQTEIIFFLKSSLFKGISNFVSYLMSKSSLEKTVAGKVIYTILTGITPKVNVIARVKFELTYYDVAV